jgi:hypothetical protein
MNFPLKGDEKFLRNLKKDTPLYIAEVNWNKDSGKMDLVIKTILFDHYEQKMMDGDKNSIPAVLRKGSISTETHNILYGFYETPMKAMESMRQLYQAGLDATKQAIKEENKRLQKLVNATLPSEHTSPKTEVK